MQANQFGTKGSSLNYPRRWTTSNKAASQSTLLLHMTFYKHHGSTDQGLKNTPKKN